MTTPKKSLRIGRFLILKPLGRGLQGAVYLARDPDLDRLVAIKLVGATIAQPLDEGGGWSQARNLARLRHPNIVALHELGRFHNFTYLVFEYLEGVPLRKELNSAGALALPEAFSTISQVTDAMAYAHAKGILHLDLNPNNIMRDEAGKPRIMDFDLSRQVGVLHVQGDITGTLPYMAPEHFTTRKLDPRTDVYALGQILYELLCGAQAVPAGADIKRIAAICKLDADFGRLEHPDPTGAFTRVVQKATAKKPGERFENAREMHAALLAAWAQSRSQVDEKKTIIHGTVAFVMKRIERRGDFPAVPRTLVEINQLTRGNRQPAIPRLASVILRDYALASRLLKLSNSAYYARASGKIKTVSKAINMLGIDRVRLACNSLACFGHFSGRKQDLRLKEESIASFIAGLSSRHLAAQLKSLDTEEAFLAGMRFSLGKMLVLFYFPEDYVEIEALVARGATPNEAARSVLGISLAELGHGMGSAWGLPNIVLDCMLDPSAAETSGENDELRPIVRFANLLTAVAPGRDIAGDELAAAVLQLRPRIVLDPEKIHGLLQAAVDKFDEFAAALEVNPARSECVQRLKGWLADNQAHLDAATQADPETVNQEAVNIPCMPAC